MLFLKMSIFKEKLRKSEKWDNQLENMIVIFYSGFIHFFIYAQKIFFFGTKKLEKKLKISLFLKIKKMRFFCIFCDFFAMKCMKSYYCITCLKMHFCRFFEIVPISIRGKHGYFRGKIFVDFENVGKISHEIHESA